MKLYSLKCPECGAQLEIESGVPFFFCKYCGSKIHVDEERKEVTVNKNIHKTVDINRTDRYIDEAQIVHEQYQLKSKQHDIKVTIIAFLLISLVCLSLILPGIIKKEVSIARGKISAGNYEELIEQDYKTVVAHFEAAGFENIEVIDLDDSGILFWREGKVEQISIAGDTTFWSGDYFPPDATVVISHH